jgi:hypothetical protein
MAGEWTTERFPQFEASIQRLAEKHRELDDEPLHLAMAYQPAGPKRDQQHIYLFEVIGGWGESNPDRELFETTFDPNSRLHFGFEQQMHLILTTPQEFRTALEERWPSTNEIVVAVRNGDFKILHADAEGDEVLDLIKRVIAGEEGVRHA